MSDQFKEKKIEDTEKEHENFHQSFHSDCSECFRENRLLKAKVTVIKECEFCHDTGFIEKTEKTEWAEPNESYDVIIRCSCQED